MNRKIEISVRTVLFAAALIVGGWLFVQVRDILFLLFIAFLFMTAIHPLVLFLERARIPRPLAILLIYVVLFGLFGASLVSAVPALVSQSTRLTQELPQFASRVLPYWNIDVSNFTDQIAPIGESVVKLTLGIFSNIISLVTVLVFTFYFLMGRRYSEKTLEGFVGEHATRDILRILRAIEQRLGAWVRGELILMSFVGLLYFIGLIVLHVEFALPLSILAGLLEIVPMIGPTLAAIPAILVALAVSPFLALSVAALYVIVQQVENNFLVPIVMKKSVGFAPIVTILALMIGGRLAGIIGAILAVPVALVIQELSLFVLAKHDVSLPKSTKNPSKS